jgi:hypothetical protein
LKRKLIGMINLADGAPKEVLYDMGISRHLLNRRVSTDRWRTIGDIRYTPDPVLRREPLMGPFTIAELRTFVPVAGFLRARALQLRPAG